MLKQINILILLMMFLNIGCSEHKPTNISDCERMKNEPKRDVCFARLVESAQFNDTNQNIGACMRIFDVELKDLCLFKVAQDSWRNMPVDPLRKLCDNISAEPLRNSCYDITRRPHLQAIR